MPKFSKPRTLVLIIDAQNSFCDPKGSLFVPGADADCLRAASWMRANLDHIDAITATMDSHHNHAIFFQNWHVGKNGDSPPLFFQMTLKHYLDGEWTTRDPAHRERTIYTLRGLEDRGRQVCTIWPKHCIVGGEGWSIQPHIFNALSEWEERSGRIVSKVTKGTNPYTEHYSPFGAEVPYTDDPSTQLALDLITNIDRYDRIYVIGEALSHCVANGVRDLLQYLPSGNLGKITLVSDCMSNVTGFEHLGNNLLADAQSKGVKVAPTTDLNLSLY